MLTHLWELWQQYLFGQRGPTATWREIRVWMEQHCLDSDDFAFSVACSMRDAVFPLA